VIKVWRLIKRLSPGGQAGHRIAQTALASEIEAIG
jgi:hypothetical protein